MIRTLLYRTCFVLSVAFLSFVFGGISFGVQNKPGIWLKQVVRVGTAYYEWMFGYKDIYQTNLWIEARSKLKGVTVYDSAKAFNGYTLYTSAEGQIAYLIDMNGAVVHKWSVAFDQIWPDPQHVNWPKPSTFTTYRDVKVNSDGSLLVSFSTLGKTPYGYGLAKIDKHSKVIWRYSGLVHHEFDMGYDGRIYSLLHWLSTRKVPHGLDIAPVFLEDAVVIISPDGKEIDRISLVDALLNSKYQSALAEMGSDDPFHTNSVQLIPSEFAEKVPFSEAGDLLISMRTPSLLVILRPRLRSVIWASFGPWRKQHHAVPLATGNILLFDNLGQMGPAGRSRIIEFNPLTHEIAWAYSGSHSEKSDTLFDSELRGEVQRLPNGNTLIVESGNGRVFEVTESQEIVWEFIIPLRGGKDNKLVPVIQAAERIGKDQVPFLVNE